MPIDRILAARLDRRSLLGATAAAGVSIAMPPALQSRVIGGSSPLASFAGKRGMILHRARPPLLETSMDVFDRGVFTPNDQFFVRWHWAGIPTSIDADSFRLTIRGAVGASLSLSLAELLRMPRVELAAVNQCSGNSRSLFQPRVPGAQWGHGAMGNAKWLGVSLLHVLDLAGVRAGATAVRFGALDRATSADRGLDFDKSLSLDHARDGEVMIAFAMNGEQLPLLNGFPLRLVVPGWYSTYWVKMLSDIEVLDAADDHYWTAKAYRIPAIPGADVPPGSAGFPTTPINAMVPRSWVTNFAEGDRVPFEPTLSLRGIALGGDSGVSRVEVSTDGGNRWQDATLGEDYGRYSFRQWEAQAPLASPGPISLQSRCTNQGGVVQPSVPIWNPSGYMRGNIETTEVVIA
ncbi:MAG: molybdopterin-dependent oxidoreductase [Candidatus Andeanibacterium colombiense]|uniref:Molybdopterin-dependent oxidoreductase n=1 Tax=Candidatus Andeanibacterium colombiense TaxID=3121345 RepID=A0AAJ5X586_9SPHN|nr:MAG: molybdopterin-dependent oxidoreductase [Sphingomonadaceae bacterium]